MALAMRLASSDVSFTVPKRPLVEVVPAMDGRDHDAVAVLHHERIRVRPVHGPARQEATGQPLENKTGTRIKSGVRWCRLKMGIRGCMEPGGTPHQR